MRIIKFRFWDSFNECYSYSDNQSSLYAFFNLYEATEKGDNNPILEHFTGLVDKNGKEIYDGDIVEAWSEGYKHTGEIRFRLEAQPCYIIYPAFANQGFWKIHGQKNRKGIYTDDGIEVIGNIHENPELIKPKEEKK